MIIISEQNNQVGGGLYFWALFPVVKVLDYIYSNNQTVAAQVTLWNKRTICNIVV